MHKTSNIIPLVKKALADHKKEHGDFLDDKDYEHWFVKYYVHYMDSVNVAKASISGHKKNGLR
jgi:hypothetical protein